MKKTNLGIHNLINIYTFSFLVTIVKFILDFKIFLLSWIFLLYDDTLSFQPRPFYGLSRFFLIIVCHAVLS